MRKHNSYHLKVPEEQRDYLVEELRIKRQFLDRAKEEYAQVMHAAFEAGMNNSEIGRAVGQSEAAIRVRRKRHESTT